MEVDGDVPQHAQTHDTPQNTDVNGDTQLNYPHVPRYNVGYVYSSEMLKHFSMRDSEHVERPARIEKIWDLLREKQCLDKMYNIPIKPLQKQEALLVHTENHWQKVLAFERMTAEQIEQSAEYYDTLSLYVGQGTTRAALISCGAVIQACLAVARGQLRKSLAIVRPPGHHAEPDEHMGFCLFNNVAVAAKVVQQVTPIKKILILDWDVHHGNGTQRAFEEDENVLYISIHRYDGGTFYPNGTYGGAQSCGIGAGLGRSVNIPWPDGGMGDADYILAFQKIVMPIALEFAPELVIISAGFDAADGDDLGGCHVTPPGYAHMTYMLAGLAGGRLVVALEGGYNVEAIANSTYAVTKVLLGEPPDELGPMVASEEGAETIWLVAKEQSRFWNNVDPKQCEPREDFDESTFSIPEILKAHRQQYMHTMDMMQIPLLLQTGVDPSFDGQIICTSDLFEETTDALVVFVHEFGNLRVELDAHSICDVDTERSYLIDFSKELIGWVRSANYSLIDVNLFPKPTVNGIRPKSDDLAKQILVYLWDNYIQLCGATKVILIGHGPGCAPLIKMIEDRASGMRRLVRGVAQIVGHGYDSLSPKCSDDDRMKKWFSQNSFVALPNTHRLIGPQMMRKTVNKFKEVCPFEEPRAERLMRAALPQLKTFVDAKLRKKVRENEDGDDI